MEKNPTSAKASAGGKTGKYFKYAIGEIVLVVIGILIALQINNWNEGRKLKIEERKVVKRLIKETKKDIVFYKSRIDGINEESIITFNKLLLIGDGKANDSILDSVLPEYFSFSGGWSYESSLVKNNSNTNEIIQSDEIKEKLQEVFFIYEYVDKACTISNDLKYNLGIPLDIKYYKTINSMDSLLLYSHLKTPLKDPEVLGIITNFISWDENALAQIEKMQKSLKEFLELLEAYSSKIS